MRGPDRDEVMERFQRGDVKVLVATTVIEVGVDVPRATVMVIEHAERFGLSQLHQLRGRIGRGDRPSTCLLVYKGPVGETAKARLETMRRTEDGFAIAEEDLRLRGEGELLGARQSGAPVFRLARLERDGDLLATARNDARLVIERDPDLASERGQALAAAALPLRPRRGRSSAAGGVALPRAFPHSTVTDLARLRGWSTSFPMNTAAW
jgi:ATP-dependent DNA helicase RecG